MSGTSATSREDMGPSSSAEGTGECLCRAPCAVGSGAGLSACSSGRSSGGGECCAAAGSGGGGGGSWTGEGPGGGSCPMERRNCAYASGEMPPASDAEVKDAPPEGAAARIKRDTRSMALICASRGGARAHARRAPKLPNELPLTDWQLVRPGWPASRSPRSGAWGPGGVQRPE